PNAPDYWEDAWEATRDVEALAGERLPREDLSLAINSPYARTQNQLHIHIDCIRTDVAEALRTHADEIGDTWAPFAPKIGRTPYRAIRVPTLQQPGANPFQLLARSQPDMSRETLAVVGATLPGGVPGFYLLETRADPAVPFSGGAEELQDHDCKIAHLPMQN
ncbi:MAG: CDP-diacylglycerol diphosphatase, partial [Acetobacteraceae bacterium]|nr:CDP-diacylglycerol diphosphatase [Acetobacteraceae bacterium]